MILSFQYVYLVDYNYKIDIVYPPATAMNLESTDNDISMIFSHLVNRVYYLCPELESHIEISECYPPVMIYALSLVIANLFSGLPINFNGNCEYVFVFQILMQQLSFNSPQPTSQYPLGAYLI